MTVMTKNQSKVNRPMRTWFNIRIDPVTKKRLFFIAEQEGTTASEKIRKMINQAAAHYPDAPSNVTGHQGGK
jgi:predicted HicB family RNase H-like nuclease